MQSPAMRNMDTPGSALCMLLLLLTLDVSSGSAPVAHGHRQPHERRIQQKRSATELSLEELQAAADRLKSTAKPVPDIRLAAAAAAHTQEHRQRWTRCSTSAGTQARILAAELELQALVAAAATKQAYSATAATASSMAVVTAQGHSTTVSDIALGNTTLAPSRALSPDDTVQAPNSTVAQISMTVSDPNITVPVVFHVVTYRGEGSVTLQQIRRQMNILNRSYNPWGFYFQLLNATTYEADTAALYNADSGQDSEYVLKSTLRTGSAQILNIYTLAPGGAASTTLGWSTFPFQYQESTTQEALDGVVVRYTTLPLGPLGQYSLGDTAVHETGHWLGLYHTFQGGCGSVDGTGGDLVLDTAPEATAASGCPRGRDTCANDNVTDPIFNFMDYTTDNCMREFTPGQAARMRLNWNSYRAAK